MEASQGDELKFVSHCGEFSLEVSNVNFVELRLPVERWGAVIGKHLVREELVDCAGIATRFVHVGFGGFPPEQIGIRRICDAASDGCVETSGHAEEAFG